MDAESKTAVGTASRSKQAGGRRRWGLAVGLLVLAAVVVLVPLTTTRTVQALQPAFDTPNILVDDSAADVYSPRIVTAAGVLHAAWLDLRNGNLDVYYSRSSDSGATWLPSVRIDDTPLPIDAEAMDLAVNSTGTEVYVVWTDSRTGNPDVYVRASNNGGVAWGAGVRADDAAVGRQAWRPAIAVGATGVVHVVWEDDRNVSSSNQIFSTRSTNEGTTWGDGLVNNNDVQVSRSVGGRIAGFPAVTAVGSAEVHAVWEEYGSGSEYVYAGNSFDGGASWTAFQVSTGAGGVTAPDVAATGPGGTVFATWSFQPNVPGTIREVFFARSTDGGVTWTPSPTTVSDISAPPPGFLTGEPSLSMLLGDPYVVWEDTRNTFYDLFASGSDDGGTTWGDGFLNNNDARVDDSVLGDFQFHASTAASVSGLYVLWEDDRNAVGVRNDIYFARYVVSEVMITEFRDAPDVTQEVVEIVNFGGKTVDFTGWSLVVDGNPYSLTGLTSVPPMQYRTVGNWLGATLQPPGFALGDGLLNHGGTIQIRNNLGVVVDEVRWGRLGVVPDPLNTVSSARCFNGASYEDGWAMDLSTTFNAQNDGGCVIPNPALILNEVLYWASSPAARFVELIYMGSTTLNTTGYRLVGGSVYTISGAAGVTLDSANRFGMVSNADNPLFFNNLLTTGDNLYLYDAGWNLLDQVGWDTNATHQIGMSICRQPDGAGTYDGYNDPTSWAASWRWPCVPTPPLVAIGPSPQYLRGDFGDTVRFNLTMTNKQLVSDFLDLTYTSEPNVWPVQLWNGGDTAPLADGDGDSIPDAGLQPREVGVDITVRVMVPVTVPLFECEWINVTATASATAAFKTAELLVCLYPFLTATTLLGPTTVNVLGTGFGEVATLTLTATAHGLPVPQVVAADVVLMMDSSGSMEWNDPSDPACNNEPCRLYASKSLLDWMEDPVDRAIGDRVSIVDFDSDCEWTPSNDITLEHHLDSFGHDGNPNYNDPRNDINTIDYLGGTNLLCPLEYAETEFATLGYLSRQENGTWVGILLTDGEDSLGRNLTVQAQADVLAALKVKVYTIMLDPPAPPTVNPWLLQYIASVTKAKFYSAASASTLIQIFRDIAIDIGSEAARDPWNLTSPIPMMTEVLPPYITVDPFSYRLAPGNLIETDPFPDCTPQPACWTGGTLPWNVTSMSVNETWSVSFDIRCSLEGTNPVQVVPDSQINYRRPYYIPSATPLITVNFPDQPITCVSIVPPALTPPKNVTTNYDGASGLSLGWELPTIIPDHYIVYRAAGTPMGFTDLSVSSPQIVGTPPGPSTAWSDPTPLPAGPGEYYYVMRASDALGSDVSTTSNTAGVFVGTLTAGLNAISRPLEYFPWVDYSGAAQNTVGEYAAAFGATIQYMDGAGRWQPGSANPTLPLIVGDAYLATRGGTPGRFVFTGLPGAHISYDDPAPFAGFGLVTEARSVTATPAGNDVSLAWTAAPGASRYEVWHATARTGFFDGTALPLASVAGVGWVHPGALLAGTEHYYLIIPFNGLSQRGASAYTIGVWTATYAPQDTFALPLRATVAGLGVDWYATAVPNTLGIVWLTAGGVWVPHFTAMPASVYDAYVVLGGGYQITVGPAAPVRYIFVGR